MILNDNASIVNDHNGYPEYLKQLLVLIHTNITSWRGAKHVGLVNNQANYLPHAQQKLSASWMF